jgi:3-hydroxyacyl-CoA dehydrogenase
MSPHQPEPPPLVVVAPVEVVDVPATGEAAGEAAVVVVVVVVELLVVAAGLAAGLAWATAIAGIVARAAAKTRPAAPLPKASFIRGISSYTSSACWALLPALRALGATEPPLAFAKRSNVMIQTPIVLEDIRKDPGRVLAATPGACLLDLDDGVLCLEFHSKGNTLDGDTLTVAEHAFETIPGSYKGLVVGNQGKHFSFGANLAWLLKLLEEIGGDRDRFHAAAKRFQRVTTGMRITPFPTVAAPFELTIGGALELSMYADRVQAHSGMRASLPEVAVGILPDLGGTSELYVRCMDAAADPAEGLRQAFQTIVFMRASKDAQEARAMHFLKTHDGISTDLASLIADAKMRVLELCKGYVTPTHRRGIPVLGDAGYAELDKAIVMAESSGMATAYDAQVARAIARVMTGGPGNSRLVTHEELLDLETQYFETLVFNNKTKERMKYMLENGKPLRN